MFKKIPLLPVFLVLSTGLSWVAGGWFTFVIDPGHGGRDAGAMGAIPKEKDINLNVALVSGRYVERNLPDVNVIYACKTDVPTLLYQRTDIASKAKADLPVSVRTSSVASGRYVKGFRVYTLGMHRVKANLDAAMRENSVISMERGHQQTYQGFDPDSSESYIMFEFMQNANMERSVELAQMIQNPVCSSVGHIDKGVRQAGFLVLRESYIPSCLIELNFITAADEEEYLNSPEGIDAMAKGIYNAFVQYKDAHDIRIVVPYRPIESKRIVTDRVVPTVPTTKPRLVAPIERSRSVVPVQHSRSIVSVEQPRSSIPAPPACPINKVQEAKKRISDAIRELSPCNDTENKTSKAVPVFKIQVLASNRQLRSGNELFHGRTDIDCVQEGNFYKYFIGSSMNYNDTSRLCGKLLKDFLQASTIVYKNGVRMDVNQAIAELLKNKKNEQTKRICRNFSHHK